MIRHSTANRIPKFWPFQESVVYYYRTSGDTFTSYSVSRARRKKIDKKDGSFSPDILAVAELSWQVVASQLGVEPQLDDYLVDGSGVRWIVLGVVEQFNGQVFNLATRKGV